MLPVGLFGEFMKIIFVVESIAPSVELISMSKRLSRGIDLVVAPDRLAPKRYIPKVGEHSMIESPLPTISRKRRSIISSLPAPTMI